MQSKKSSMMEIGLNTGSGFIVSLVVTASLQNSGLLSSMSPLGITAIFTVVSLVRSYTWRRVFNKQRS